MVVRWEGTALNERRAHPVTEVMLRMKFRFVLFVAENAAMVEEFDSYRVFDESMPSGLTESLAGQ